MKSAVRLEAGTRPIGRRAGFAAAALLTCWAVGAPFSAAQSTATSAPQSQPGFESLASQAAAARASGDVARAIDLYSQAVAANPSWPEGWWYLGLLQYGACAYAGGRDALSRFIALTPHAGPATALRGLCEYETGEYPQALKDIQAGLADGAANQPRNERILRAHEALLQTRGGRFEDALATYAYFARSGAPAPEMAAGIGLAGLRKPLLPNEVDPAERALYQQAGEAVFNLIAGDRAAADSAFQALFARYPATANLHYIYGYYLFAADPEAGASEFRRELQVSPGNAAAEAMLAWSALLREDAAEALPYAKKAALDDPSLPLAQLVLGRALVDTGDLKEGTGHLEKAAALDPGNIEDHLALVRAYSEAGRVEDARRERLQCLAMTKDQPVAHL